jgi:uncharacterized repeat protein (TIGR03803 family)
MTSYGAERIILWRKEHVAWSPLLYLARRCKVRMCGFAPDSLHQENHMQTGTDTIVKFLNPRAVLFRAHSPRRVAAAMTLLLALVPPVCAQQFQDIYDFNCTTGGCIAYDLGHLTQWKDGNLYGMTNGGGTNGLGTIFMVTPAVPSVYKDVYEFDGTNGASPWGGLTLASDGNFYGVANTGGANNFGTVFRFTPPSTLTVLHSFNGSDGQIPIAPPVQGKNGNLYGVTGIGTTYRITLPSGKFTQFKKNAPGQAEDPLCLASDGNLYGVTTAGGNTDLGTVFRMTTTGAIKVLYTFMGGTDGSHPTGGLIQGKAGYLYGTNETDGTGGGGTIFKISTSGTLNTVHTFDVPVGGYGPVSGLVAASDGSFYGTTGAGGASGDGSLFQFTTGGVYNDLFDFTGTGTIPGSTPYAALVQHTNGTLYGTTPDAAAFADGNIYSLTPANPLLTLIIEGPIFVLPGVPVEILGNNLGEVSQVSFAGVQAQFQSGSDTYLTATVPMNAVDGFVTATFPSGQQIQSQQSMHILPIITNLDPSSGSVGTQVGIVGGGFAGTTRVTFGGVKATTFTVVTPGLIQAIMPVGAKTGKVAVTTPNGRAVSKQTFTVN